MNTDFAVYCFTVPMIIDINHEHSMQGDLVYIIIAIEIIAIITEMSLLNQKFIIPIKNSCTDGS